MGNNLEELKSKLLNHAKGSILSTVGEEEGKDWFSTSTYDLNRILSGSLYKSFQVGTHTAFIGQEASGKSSLMAINLADAQKKGYLPLIVDCEGAWDKEFMERWGIDPDNVLKINTLWVEDISVELAKIQDSGFQNLAIAIDSIGAIDSKKVIADAKESGDIKSDQGQVAKRIKRMLKVLVSIVKFSNSIAFSAGHLYGKPESYGTPEEIGGGKYYRLSADVIISLKKTHIYENPSAKTKADKGKIIGTQINAATLKNRKHPPFMEGVVQISFEKGVDKLAGIVDLCKDMGLIEQAGAWYRCDSLGIKEQGYPKFLNKLYQCDYQPLLYQIEEVLKTTGYSTVNKLLEEQLGQPEEEEPVELDDEDEETNEDIENDVKENGEQ